MEATHNVTSSKVWINTCIWLSCPILLFINITEYYQLPFPELSWTSDFQCLQNNSLYIFFTIFTYLLFFIIFGLKCFVLSELLHVWQWNATWMPSYFFIRVRVHKYVRFGSPFVRKYVFFDVTKSISGIKFTNIFDFVVRGA